MVWMQCPKCGAYLVNYFCTVPNYYCGCGWIGQSFICTTNSTGVYTPQPPINFEKPEEIE